MISAGIVVFSLVVHWHPVGIVVGASMVDTSGIVACCIVLAYMLLPVDGSINRFWIIWVKSREARLVGDSLSYLCKYCLNLMLAFCQLWSHWGADNLCMGEPRRDRSRWWGWRRSGGC